MNMGFLVTFSNNNRSRAGCLKSVVFILLIGCLVLPRLAIADSVRIGVLSLRGDDKAVEAWQGMLDYLNTSVSEHEFILVPLGFDQINLAIRQHNVDFLIANSSIFVTLENQYGASAIATLYTKNRDGTPVNYFGGVIFSRVDQQGLSQIAHLKNKRVAAVDETSLGGWQTGLREILKQGVTPEEFGSLDFLHTHDAVVNAVLTQQADVGLVRTGTLEKMAEEGQIDLNDFYVIANRHLNYFPYQISTQLYPEWPLAKLPHVSDDLALEVALSLFALPESQLAYHSAYGAGWGLPQNYQPIHTLLRELKLPPYHQVDDPNLPETLQSYWPYILIAGLFFLLGIGVLSYVIYLNKRLYTHQKSLNSLNTDLEERVLRRTSQIESLLEHEKYLRSIVHTIADVNQIIITSTHRMEMLKSACDRLVSHPEYRFAWVASVNSDKHIERLVSSYGTSEQLIALTQSAGILSHIEQAIAKNQLLLLSSDEQLDFLGLRAGAFIPLRSDAFSKPIGMICVYTQRQQGFDDDEITMLDQLAGDLGFAMHAFIKREESEQAEASRISNYEETIQAMVEMIEKRDTYTAGHTRRVAHYSELIARKMGFSEEQIQQLIKASTLHDIGKIIIPDAVLLKPGALTPLEYELIKQHVTVGYETLSAINMYKDLAELMRHHHERLDGSGYPQGLKGDEIPLASRVMAVADSFDAMTSNRIYKPRMTQQEAINELQELAGVHYDPPVVEAAVQVFNHLDIDDKDHQEQLPASDLERQRFAYFFNDQLTGLYNADYLQFMLKRGLQVHFKSLHILLLNHFAEYNTQHGWHAGNQLLKAFAEWLEQHYPNALLFRVMGDDFVVINAPESGLDQCELQQNSPLAKTVIEIQHHHFTTDDAGLDELRGYIR